MSVINIATFDIPNWQLGGASCTLRIFADQTFRNSDGDVILRGSAKGPWYQEIACTISGTTITVPQFTIDSTTDASNRNATYTGILFDSNDVRRDAFFSAYKIPHNFGSTVGWAAIHAYNSSVKSILPYAYPNTDQVAAIVAGIFAGAQPLDADLTAIAALSPSNDDIVQRKAGAWTNRTVAQYKTDLGIAADITAAVDALIDSAPGALDTLNELAAALGDDANFATTVTNALATKQPLDSELTALATLTSAANKVPMFSGPGAATLLDFKDEDNMASDSATAVSSQQSVKAYVDTTVGGIVGIPDAFNVTNYGATGDGSTDDTAAIQAAIDAANPGGTVILSNPSVFYKCDGQLDLSSTENVTILGGGARTEIKDDLSYSRVIYTGTGSYFIDAKRSRGLTLKGLDIRYNNSGFTGDLLTTNFFLVGGAVGYNLTVRNCIFASTANSIRTARSGMYLAGMVRANISDNAFYWTDYGIIGYSASSGDTPYSTAVTVTRNWFNEVDIAGIANPHQQWSIIANVFEPLYSSGNAGGIHCGILNGGLSDGVYVAGNGFWDVTTGSGSWIIFAGYGLELAGNYVNLGNAATFLKIGATSNGIKVGGGSLSGSAGATVIDGNGQTVGRFAYDGTMKIDGGITLEANMGAVTRSAQSFSTITTPVLISSGDAGSPVPDTGAGTGPTVSVSGSQLAGRIVVTAGTTPASDANILAVAWATEWSSAPVAIILTPANEEAAALSGASQVYVDRTQTTTDRFFVRSGNTGLADGVVYEWYFQVIQ